MYVHIKEIRQIKSGRICRQLNCWTDKDKWTDKRTYIVVFEGKMSHYNQIVMMDSKQLTEYAKSYNVYFRKKHLVWKLIFRRRSVQSMAMMVNRRLAQQRQGSQVRTYIAIHRKMEIVYKETFYGGTWSEQTLMIVCRPLEFI